MSNENEARERPASATYALRNREGSLVKATKRHKNGVVYYEFRLTVPKGHTINKPNKPSASSETR